MEIGTEETDADGRKMMMMGEGESRLKCLFCFESAEGEGNKLTEFPDLVTSFVTLSTQDVMKFGSLPKKLLSDGMRDGFYCNKCWNRLYELDILQNEIKSLQKRLQEIENEIETEILNTYYKLGDAPAGAEDSRGVAELRRRFYKSEDTDKLHLLIQKNAFSIMRSVEIKLH